ncbi:MAG: methyltransferase [Pseudomonadota bacterium]
MTTTEKDHPNVIAFPPLIFASALVIEWLLGMLIPLSVLPAALSSWSLAIGILLCIAAAAIALAGILAFRRAGTHVEPHKPSLVLVGDGPYRFTRNPMYVGLILLLLGLSLMFSLDWGIGIAPVFALVLHHGVVLREEALV